MARIGSSSIRFAITVPFISLALLTLQTPTDRNVATGSLFCSRSFSMSNIGPESVTAVDRPRLASG